MILFFGKRASNIGNFDIPNSKCDYCEQERTQKVSVFGSYAHIFWIPIFPIGKKAVAECTHCKRTIDEKEFSSELRQLYRMNKSKARRPWWHGCALWLLLGVTVLIVAIGIYASTLTIEDPRGELLVSDMDAMVSNPTMESDSISYKIKTFFDNFANEEVQPSEFKYLTKVEDNKALILVQIPKLRKVEREARMEVLEIIELIVNSQADLEGTDKYIGVQGVISMILIKTPTYEKNSRVASQTRLYEFYGPRPETEESN